MNLLLISLENSLNFSFKRKLFLNLFGTETPPDIGPNIKGALNKHNKLGILILTNVT